MVLDSHHPDVGIGHPSYGAASVSVRVAPPGRVVEVAPTPPPRGYVWQSGYWRWTGVRYLWVPGSYAPLPQPGLAWIPGRWVRHTGGWVWVNGYWRP